MLSTSFRHALLAAALLLAPAALAQDESGETRLMALNLYHEARNGGRASMVATGWVVLNRVADAGFPNSIEGVIREGEDRGRCQWGWLCDGRSDEPTDRESWALAQEVAGVLLADDPPADPTGGAVWMMESWRKAPGWLRQAARRTTVIGGNAYYARR